jgi:hypothetical protein
MKAEHLTHIQTYGLVGLGAFFWAVAAMTVRYTGHVCFANDLRRLSTYIAIIPASYVIILSSEALVGSASKQRLTATVIMDVTALMLDGAAFMWFPTLYENPELKKKNSHMAIAFSRMGAGSILWGAGVILGIALLA